MSVTAIRLEMDTEQMQKIFGMQDAYIKKLEQDFQVTIVDRNGSVMITGEEENVSKASRVLRQLTALSDHGNEIEEQSVDYAIEMGKEDQEEKLMEMDAGTGKTYLAMAMAITAFKNNEVSRIILTRPAIEAGEKLGFLPGDLQSKVDPYLRPLYDALYQIMGAESFAKNMEKGLIEVAPLAYMRGRTLDNAYIILDEAQNTTPAQMKMFLTRIGFGSKVIVTGDSSQKDLPVGAKSGLDVAARVLKNIDDIAFCTLTSKDVVRHPLVQKIVKAYDDYEARTIKSKRSPRLNKRPDKGNR